MKERSTLELRFSEPGRVEARYARQGEGVPEPGEEHISVVLLIGNPGLLVKPFFSEVGRNFCGPIRVEPRENPLVPGLCQGGGFIFFRQEVY